MFLKAPTRAGRRWNTLRSRQSFAFSHYVKVSTLAGISDDVEYMRVNRSDILNALEEVQLAFGVSEEELEQVVQNGGALEEAKYVFQTASPPGRVLATNRTYKPCAVLDSHPHKDAAPPSSDIQAEAGIQFVASSRGTNGPVHATYPGLCVLLPLHSSPLT